MALTAGLNGSSDATEEDIDAAGLIWGVFGCGWVSGDEMGEIADALEVGCRCLRDGDTRDDGPSAVMGDCSSIDASEASVRVF